MHPFRFRAGLGWATAVFLLVGCVVPGASLAVIPPAKPHAALSPLLAELARPAVRSRSLDAQARAVGLPASGPGSLVRSDGRVLVYVRFDRGALAALPSLRESGAAVVSASRSLQTVTARLDPADLDTVAAEPRVTSVAPVRAPLLRAFEPCEGGSVVSEGVSQIRAQEAREAFGVEGQGLTVGVLSDSFNQALEAVTGGPVATKAPEDVLSKDLPGRRNTCAGQRIAVEDLEDYRPEPEEEDPFDEGRGMLQIVHDVAPKADLAFNSAFNGEPAFAAGIERLAEPVLSGGAGAEVIVDDVSYFEEPFFQDGPVAAAVNKVSGEGVTYVSAAGNDNLFDSAGNEIASWEAPAYRDSGNCPQEVRELAGFNGHHCLDFNPGAAVDRTFGIKVEPHETLSVDLQWAEPWFGVGTDLDAFLLDAEGRLLAASFEENVTKTQQPVEVLQWVNPTAATQTVQMVVNRFSGAAPRLKFILLENGGGVSATEYPKSGGGDVVGPSIYGHSGAAGAIAVGAIRYEPRAGEGVQPEEYSSRGPVTHYFGPVEGAEAAEPLGAPEELSKPDVTATDCGRTTFFAVEAEPGVWRFCGTSAAAPHAAGVAALMREEAPAATPQEVKEALAASGQPIEEFDSCAIGGGLLDAVVASERILAGPPFNAPEACPPPDASGPVFVASGSWGLENPPAPKPTPTPTPTPTPEPEPETQPESTPTEPGTTFVKHPKARVEIRGASARLVFRFHSDQAGATFLCKVDSTTFRPCGPMFVARFKPGKHVLRVKARSSAGLVDPSPAVFRFRVERLA